jgi:hypothetical protein
LILVLFLVFGGIGGIGEFATTMVGTAAMVIPATYAEPMRWRVRNTSDRPIAV